MTDEQRWVAAAMAGTLAAALKLPPKTINYINLAINPIVVEILFFFF